MKRFFSLLLAVMMIFSLASCGKNEKDDEKKDDGNGEKYAASDIAVSTENFSFTRAEISYIFHKNYTEFKLKYPDSVDMYNIDTDASLKGQVYHDDYTWFSYFADSAVEYAKQVLAFCEGAKAEGVELTDEDRQSIDDAVKSWTDYARDYEFDEDELFAKYFNKDVTADTLRSFMEKEMLSLRYQELLSEKLDFSSEQVEAYATEHADSFLYIDYLKIVIDEDDVATPKAEADKIAAAKTPEEFLSLAKQYLTDVLKESDEDVTEELEEARVTGEKKKTYGTFSKWAFSEGIENGTFVDENSLDGEWTVYMLLKTPYRDTDATRNLRIIKENVASHNSFKETSDYLSDMLDKWKKDGGTEEAFAELAEKNSDDEDTRGIGGLVTAVNRFDGNLDESITEWLFDGARVIGDTGVVKGEKCYYALLFTGEDLPGWEISARIGLAQIEMQSTYDGLLKNHPVTVNDKVVNSLEA